MLSTAASLLLPPLPGTCIPSHINDGQTPDLFEERLYPSPINSYKDMSSMRSAPIPFILEDRSAVFNSTDFDDIYDRVFLRIADSPKKSSKAVSMIYDMGRRSSRKRDSRHFDRQPSVVLEFETSGGLGNIHFLQPPAVGSLPMHQYLRKSAMFGSSLSRRFRGSDNQEYRWSHRTVEGQEWSCVNSDNHIVAQYTLKPPSVPAFHVSGNTLTIHEGFSYLAVEILASLTIMRHIAHHNI